MLRDQSTKLLPGLVLSLSV